MAQLWIRFDDPDPEAAALEHLCQGKTVIPAAEDHDADVTFVEDVGLEEAKDFSEAIGFAEERDQVAWEKRVLSCRDDGGPATLNDCDTDAGGQGEFKQAFARGFAVGRNVGLLEFNPAAGQFLDEQAFGISDEFREFDGCEAFGTKKVIDLEMRFVIEKPFFPLGVRMNARDGFPGTESAGHGSGNEIGIVIAGEGEEDIAFADIGFGEGGGGAPRAADDLDIEAFVEIFGEWLGGFDDGDVVELAGKSFGQVPADFAGADDNDIHGSPRELGCDDKRMGE